MVLKDIKDFHRNRLLIPICDESNKLAKSVTLYEKLNRVRTAVTPKNEMEISNALEDVRIKMDNLKQFLIKKNLWG